MQPIAAIVQCYQVGNRRRHCCASLHFTRQIGRRDKVLITKPVGCNSFDLVRVSMGGGCPQQKAAGAVSAVVAVSYQTPTTGLAATATQPNSTAVAAPTQGNSLIKRCPVGQLPYCPVPTSGGLAHSVVNIVERARALIYCLERLWYPSLAWLGRARMGVFTLSSP